MDTDDGIWTTENFRKFVGKCLSCTGCRRCFQAGDEKAGVNDRMEIDKLYSVSA